MFSRGPVDVVILAAGEPRLDGTVFAALERQASAGRIKVLDAMLLMKDQDGTCSSLDLEDLPADLAAAVGFIETGTRGLFDSDDADMLWEGMVPGSAVVALAIEHTWAVELVNAIYQAGVEAVMQIRVPALVVDEAFASLPASV